MCIAQSNAMISIVDDEYYDRAWCCLEVQIINIFQRAYGVHSWYEYRRVDDKLGSQRYALRPGVLERWPSISESKLTVESDRPRLLFLERQGKLLGNDFI
jgi:hypothetical protein